VTEAHCLPEGEAEIEAYCEEAQSTHSAISGRKRLLDRDDALSSKEVLSNRKKARNSECGLTSASSPTSTFEIASPEPIQEVSTCAVVEDAHSDECESPAEGAPGGHIVRIAEDLYGPHAPITAEIFTYGLICERFAVDSYINGHEIIGIDNLLSALQGIPTDISLDLKGLKPYVPFTSWIRVTSDNAAFFENKAYFPYLPALVLSGTVPFQLAFFFPSAFGVEHDPIYVVVLHNTAELGAIPWQLTEEFRPYECNRGDAVAGSKEREDFWANIATSNGQLGHVQQPASEDAPEAELLKYLADFGVLEAILRYAAWCESNGNNEAAAR
jgi:hypothetical protein